MRPGSSLRLLLPLMPLLLLLLWMPPLQAAQADGLAIEGRDVARLLPPKGALVTAYENNGYRLRWQNDEVVVEVTAAPLASKAAFSPPGRGAGGDPLARLALRVTTGAKTQSEAASRLLNWVARNIEYSLDREAPQSAPAVLERRTGYCTGIARLTVALLQAAGIRSREVAGYVYGRGGGPSPELGPAQGYHRWIEIYYPDAGWVFSDPLTSHNWVPANYLRLGSEQLDLGSGVDGLLLERRDQILPVDLYPGGALGVRARRNSDRQLAGALSVKVEDFEVGLASLEGAGLRRNHSLVRGTATFVGLDPGQYRLRLQIAGLPLYERDIALIGRQRLTLSVPGGGWSDPCQDRGGAGKLKHPEPCGERAPGGSGASGPGGRAGTQRPTLE